MPALRHWGHPANQPGPLTRNWLARMACIPAVAALNEYRIKR